MLPPELKAISENDIAALSACMAPETLRYYRNQRGMTLLMFAAAVGTPTMMEFLLEQGCDLNAEDCSGGNAIIEAAGSLRIENLRFLVEKGARVNATDNTGFSPLMAAARDGCVKVAQFLIDCGANIDAATFDGTTALIEACRGGHIETVEILLRHGADPKARTSIGETPLSLMEWKVSKETLASLKETEMTE